ncbi:MBOAT family O-acyltransferase [Herbaspirillum huttiense]|uniref:MBOAT family O-acyltransferase n=1 Tax=Herbaspirillum huttiense TaxID=863372 RepID=UPI003B3B0CC5
MLFHTIDFLVFFSLFLIVYAPLKRSRFAIYIIAAFSVFFYGYWDWHYLPLLLITVVMDFAIGLALERQTDQQKKKRLLIASLLVNFSILFYYKYLNFVFDLILPPAAAEHLKVKDMVLPLGISFYVFQSVSYVIDVYRGRMPAAKRFIEYLSFVTFFPHLIAGPIQRGWQLLPQIKNPDVLSPQRFSTAGYYFCKGFFYKGLGDLLSSYHDPIFNNLHTAEPGAVVVAVFSFGLQIYLDFCGYSEMAIGIARLLGVDLIRNFEEPYLSSSPQAFWRRWHISLSTWLKDYLYISLGGNREGYAKRMFNVIFVMTVCGLWHGAGIGFIIWGLLHGALIAANISLRELLDRFTIYRTVTGSWLGVGLGWLITFICVNYAWLYFRLPAYADFNAANHKILSYLSSLSWNLSSIPAMPPGLPLIFVAVLALDAIHRMTRQRLAAVSWSLSTTAALAAAAGIFFALGLLLNVGTSAQQFIYFQF